VSSTGQGGCPVPDMGLCTDVVPDRGGCPVPDMGLGIPRKQMEVDGPEEERATLATP
jgi:hypothetical protein